MDNASNHSRSGYMSEEEQTDRRKMIRDIMADPNMNQMEKSKAVQSLMDGRRRSSISRAGSIHSHTSVHSAGEEETGGGSSHNYVSAMAMAAAQAADYYSSDEEGDAIMSDAGSDNNNNGMMMMMIQPGMPHPGTMQQMSGSVHDDEQQQQNSDYYGYGSVGGSRQQQQYHDERSVASSVTHTSHRSNIDIPAGTTYRKIHGRSYSLQDWGDAEFPAAAANTSFIQDPAQISRLMEQSRPQCEHYDRMCTLVSPCCGLAFGCRICHDECPVLPKPLALRRRNMMTLNNNMSSSSSAAVDDETMMVAQRMEELKKQTQAKAERRRSMPLDFEEEENHHAIDRFAVREVICRSCYTRQSSKTNNCINCGVTFGEYHCSICNLWMSDQESPYHCEACGFCRVGGRENFRHCHDCGMCIDANLFDDHNCKAGKYMSNCPVCQEDLFSSRFATHELPCQHALHWHCYKELCSYSTQCPVCKKTAETPEYMASTWSAIATGIELQPVPPDMARCVDIFCNDCEKVDANRRWHFLGVRCLNCGSFNTTCERIVLQGRDAADFLDALEAAAAAQDPNNSSSGLLVIDESSSNGGGAAAVVVTTGSGGGGGGVPSSIAISTENMTTTTTTDDHHHGDDAPSAQETSSGSTNLS